jgi:signal transduction histidine kinase
VIAGRRLLPRPTVRLRLTLWYASIFLVAGTLMLLAAYLIVSRSLTAYYRQTEAETARGIERLVRSGQVGGPPANVVIPGPNPAEDRRRFRAEERVRKAAEARAKADQRRRVVVQFSLALGGTTLISLAAGWLVAGRALRPVSEITAAARSVSEGRLDRRIALDGPRDELKELADTFDAMLTRLDAAFASQRRFIANASHELRTPLALMRAAVDVTLDDPDALADPARLATMTDTVREAISRSERLTESLLTLASSDRGLERREIADLGHLAQSAADDLRAQIAASGLRERQRLRRCPVSGDPVLLERMVANLIENAVRYNSPGGFVEVATSLDDGIATVQVTNSGPGVPPDDLAALILPFRRAGDERQGTPAGVGLGLSIVASIARAHGGEVDLSARPVGGLVAAVRLPAAAASSSGPPTSGAPTAGT